VFWSEAGRTNLPLLGERVRGEGELL